MPMPPLYMSTTYKRAHFKLTAYKCTWFLYNLTDILNSVTVWNFIMALVIYDTHIIHFHMAPAELVALGQSYLETVIIL